MNKRTVSALCIILSAAGCHARLYDLEWYVSLYGGSSQSGDGRVDGYTIESTYTYDQPVPVVVKYPINTSFDSDNGFVSGGRVGLWFPVAGCDIGIAGDISLFRIDAGANNTDMLVLPLSALMLYRCPLLVSEDYPHGRLQPYVGVGLVGTLVDTSTRVERSDGSTFEVDTVLGGLGGSAHAGCAWCIDRHWAIFFEYRYLKTDELSGDGSDSSATPIFGDPEPITDKYTNLESSGIEAQQLLCGMSYTF